MGTSGLRPSRAASRWVAELTNCHFVVGANSSIASVCEPVNGGKAIRSNAHEFLVHVGLILSLRHLLERAQVNGALLPVNFNFEQEMLGGMGPTKHISISW